MKRKFVRGVLAAALALPLAGISMPAAAQVKVGVINSLTGVFSAFGERNRTGMEVALAEVNAAGGIHGQPLELIVQDDRSEAQSALAAVESLRNQGVPLIIGSYASSITGPMAKLMTRQKIPLIVMGSADNSITQPGSPWVFRGKHNSTIVATTYFDYFDHLRKQDPGLKRVAMLHGNGAWPTSLIERSVGLAKERGYEVVAKQSYDQGTTDFRPILNRFRSEAPDILYICSYADDGVAITRQLREVGLNTKVIAIDTSAALTSYVEQVGKLAEYVATVVSWSKDVQYEGARDLNERLKAKSGAEPSFYEAEGYLTVMIAADALRRAKNPADRESVREALAATNLKTPVTDVVFKNTEGEQGQNPIRSLVLQIQDGHHTTVFPENLAPAKPRYPTPPWDKR